MTQPSAKVILDSISSAGNRLTTMECVMHRFVLSEFNTHRMFSRNSASSRAIPVAKQIARVADDPATPLKWPTEQPGMQGGDEIEKIELAEQMWRQARMHAIDAAQSLRGMGVHKSVTNRLLEPFMWHTVIVSATDFSNFFGLRCNPLAQPEIQAVAYAMRDAYEASTPTKLGEGEWHTPYIREEDIPDDDWEAELRGENISAPVLKISAARCARVSYLTQDGVRDVKKDIELYERLVSADPPHASPLEHVATPARFIEGWVEETPGNFTGWSQLRHEVGK